MAVKGLKAGETYEDGGRTMIVDEVLPDGTYIVHAEGYEAPPQAKEEKPALRSVFEAEIRAELEPLIRAEIEERIRAEVKAELGENTQPNTRVDKGPEELKCRYCGKVYKDPQWLAAHEAKCPENKESDKE